MARALGSTPAALLAGSAEIEQAFVFTEAGMEGGLEWLEAKPRDREASFERIRLGMGAGGVEAMELHDHFGQTTLLRFSKLERNPRLDPQAFHFTPPKGADVLGEK
jgi:outer membrane lipoprotein carrier protein